MKKFITLVLCCLLLPGSVFAGGGRDRDATGVNINVMVVDGAPLVTMTQMMSEGAGAIEGYNISYTIIPDPTALVAALLNQEADFAIAPINIASMMHNNGSGYRLAAITSWSNLHIVSNQNVTSLDDLRGETIFAFGRGAIPGITLRSVLRQNNIPYVEPVGLNFTVDPNAVHIIYFTAAIDVRNVIIAGSLDGMPVRFGLMVEPVATATAAATANLPHGPFVPGINLQNEWARVNDGEIPPQAGLIFHERLLANHADFVDRFISMAEVSTVYAQNNPVSAGDIAVGFGSLSIPNGQVVSAAFNAGRFPIHFARANDAREPVNSFLQAILNEAPPLIGGRMPSDAFFHAE